MRYIMSKKGERVLTTINPNQLTRFTLNPAAHFSEVDTDQFKDGKQIRLSFGNRIIDTYLFLAGIFYRNSNTGEIIGGKAGLLDFILPQYFLSRAWMWWTKVPARAVAGFVITIPLAILDIALYVTKFILAITLTLLSLAIVGIAHLVYLDKYRNSRETIKNLMITKEDPTLLEEPQPSETEESSEELQVESVAKPLEQQKKPGFLKSFFSKKEESKVETEPAPKIVHKKAKKPRKIVEEKPLDLFQLKDGFIDEDIYYQQGHHTDEPHFIERVASYKEIFSNMKAKSELVQDYKNNLYIKVSKPPQASSSDESMNKDRIFFIKVDAENPQPLREALHLNIFGITSALENKKNEHGQSHLDRVEEVLAS